MYRFFTFYFLHVLKLCTFLNFSQPKYNIIIMVIVNVFTYLLSLFTQPLSF